MIASRGRGEGGRDDPRWSTRSCVESRRTPGPDKWASSPGGGSGSVPGRRTFERRADPAPGRARGSRGSTTRLRMPERPRRTRGVRGGGARARRSTTPPRRAAKARRGPRVEGVAGRSSRPTCRSRNPRRRSGWAVGYPSGTRAGPRPHGIRQDSPIDSSTHPRRWFTIRPSY